MRLLHSSRAVPLCLARLGAVRAHRLRPNVTPVPSPPPAAEAGALCPWVEASLCDTIETKKTSAGEHFRSATVGPVAYDGGTIRVGTVGVGRIAALDRSESQGHCGDLVLEARYLERAAGAHVPVAFAPAGDGHSEFFRAGSSAAGVYSTFHHDKDAAVVAGTHFRLVVDDAFYTGACRVEIDQR